MRATCPASSPRFARKWLNCATIAQSEIDRLNNMGSVPPESKLPGLVFFVVAMGVMLPRKWWPTRPRGVGRMAQPNHDPCQLCLAYARRLVRDQVAGLLTVTEYQPWQINP